MSERDTALQLAMKQLGFRDYDEYYHLLARCSKETKDSKEFKDWECFDGSLRGIADILETKQNITVCCSYGCSFNYRSTCTNPTRDSENIIPCCTDAN